MPFVPLDQVSSGTRRQRSGFIPLAEIGDEQPAEGAKAPRGFVPLADIEAEPEKPSVLKTVLLENPATAIGETALNLGTMGVALPVAGLAGIGTAAARAMGLTDREPADVVHSIGDALTYQPRGEFGKAATAIATAPFEALAKVGTAAGDKILDATGSPTAATAVDTAINALPMAIAPGIKGAKAAREKFSTRSTTNEQAAKATSETLAATEAGRQSEIATGGETVRQDPGGTATQAVETPRGFIPLESIDAETTATTQTRAGRLAGDDPAMHGTQTEGVEVLRRQGGNDLPSMDGEFRELPGGPRLRTDAGTLAGQAGRDGELRTGELLLDDAGSANAPTRVLPQGSLERAGRDNRGGIPSPADRGLQAAPEDSAVWPALDRGREPGSTGAQERAAADLPGRNTALGEMGETRRPADQLALAADESGLADRAGAGPAEAPRAKTARYALIEAGDLKPSKDPRASPDWYAGEKKTQEIVGEFEPKRLTEALDDAEGAPIVARSGIVEAGDKRADAIKRVYQANGIKAESYRRHLRDNADALGLDPAAIDQMKKPVLVRVPDEPAPRRPASADFPETQDMAAGVQNGTWNPGANYAPFVDQVRAPTTNAKTVADLPAPQRRERIIRELADALETHVYEGRVKGKNRLGFFRPANREVRIKNAADIEVAAHELAHLLDNKIPALSAAWRSDKVLREQLKSVSYDQKSVTEGFAEAVRLWATQAETLEAKAPRVFKWLEDFANSHEYGPPLRIAQSRMHVWFEQDALGRARSKIGDPDKLGNSPIMQHLGDWWKQQRKEWRQTVTDDLAGLYDAERSLTGKISPTGAYETARLSRGAPAITDGAIRFGAPLRKADGSYTFTGKGLHEILRPVSGRIEDFMLYAVGKSAQELMGQKREHLFSSAEIEAMVKLETPEFRTALNEFQTWNRAIVDYAQAHGVVNAESRAMWNRQIYLPFWRVSQPGEWKGGKVGDWKGVQALTGGTSNIRDVLSNVIGNANLLITKARVNDARARTVKLITENKGGHYLTEIPKESRPVKIAGEQVAEAMLKRYGIAINEPGYFEFMLTNQAPSGSNIIAVLENGKPRYFEVGDPLLFRSLAALERPPQHWLVQWLGLPRRVGQASITLDPTFIARNLARDQVMAGVMSRAGFRPMIDAMSGVYSRIVGDSKYREFIANGGGLSSLFLDDAALKKNLERFYADNGINAKTVLDTPAKMLYFVERVGDGIESSTRVGEYKRAIERGEDPRHAAYLARDVSVDWATKGDSKALGVAFETVMFLRAAVVSLDRVYRGVAHDPNRGAIAVKTGAIALASTMLYLMNRGDPRYDDMEDWKKDAFWHVWVGDEHFMIPKAFEVGAVASIAERTTERLLDADPTGLGKDFVRIVGNVFGLNWKPQIIAPIYDQATNKQGLTRTPIETPGMQDLQPAFRAKPYTSETMKQLGQMTGDLPEGAQFNPVRAEALLRGYLNAWGGYALMATDAMISDGKAPAMRTDQLPVVKGFYANEPPMRTKFENQFYEMLGEAKRLRGTLRELDETGQREWADRKEQHPLATEAKPLERAQKSLAGINNDMEAVRRDQTTTPAEKRQKLDALTVERNALLKAAVTESKAAQKAKELTPADIARKGITGGSR